MKIVYPSAKGFYEIVKSVNSLIEEGTFRVDEEGIGIVGLDQSQISMVVMDMKKENFLVYEVEGETKITLNMSSFAEILKTAKKDEMISLVKGKNVLAIHFEREGRKRTFTIPLLSGEVEQRRDLNIEFENGFRIEQKEFLTYLKDLSLISDVFKIEIKDNKVIISGNSSDGRLGRVEVGNVKLESDTEVKSSYSLKYMEDIVKNLKDEIYFRISNNKPIQILAKLNGAKLKYYVAPRIEED